MAQLPAEPTPEKISLRKARELATRRYFSPSLAGERVCEWLDDETDPVRRGYEEIINTSGVSNETCLEGIWRPGVSTIDWEESSVARTVIEPPPVAGRGGVAPGGVVWASYPTGPTQPVSQLGCNFTVRGIWVAREDIERRLAGSAAEAPKRRGATERWVYNRMKSDPPEKVGERNYAGTIFSDRPDKSVDLKRIQNLVADIRRELKLPSPGKPHKH
jgi:hypothetical protein